MSSFLAFLTDFWVIPFALISFGLILLRIRYHMRTPGKSGEPPPDHEDS